MKGGLNDTIEIFARFRPVAKNEQQSTYNVQHDFEQSVLTINKPKSESIGPNNQIEQYNFKFNSVFDVNTTQEDVFERSAKKCVLSALEGYNSTLFAYGQTGSGKTYTMTGDGNSYDKRGIIPRAINLIYEEIESRKQQLIDITVTYIEIYMDGIYDLLCEAENVNDIHDLEKVKLREDTNGEVILKGISAKKCKTEDDALAALLTGDANKSLSETAMNQFSSRSHCIYTVYFEIREPGSSKGLQSKLHLVDLAGSERVNKTKSEDQTLKEAKYINSSLFFLERVINALVHGDDHIPYRDSSMTTILRDSLGGNCKTVMVATLNPSYHQLGETISTCKFAMSVASVKQTPVVNERIDPMIVIRKLKTKVKALEEELSFYRQSDSNKPLDENEKAILQVRVNEYIQDTDAEKTLELGGSYPRIRAAFVMMKNLLLGKKPDFGKMVQSSSSSEQKEVKSLNAVDEIKKVEGSDVSEDIQEKMKSLAFAVDLRDFEISLLVDMLSKKRNRMVETDTQTEDFDQVHPTNEMLSRSIVQNVTKESILDELKQKRELAASNNPSYYHKDSYNKIVDIVSSNGMEDRFKAFEQFRKSYRKNEQAEKGKQILKQKIEEAKLMASQLNAIREKTNKLKTALIQIRTARAVSTLTESQSKLSNLDEEEAKQKDQLSKEMKNYHELTDKLKGIKKEIEYIQKSLETSRLRLKKDFEEWYRVTGGKTQDDLHNIENAMPNNDSMVFQKQDSHFDDDNGIGDSKEKTKTWISGSNLQKSDDSIVNNHQSTSSITNEQEEHIPTVQVSPATKTSHSNESSTQKLFKRNNLIEQSKDSAMNSPTISVFPSNSSNLIIENIENPEDNDQIAMKKQQQHQHVQPHKAISKSAQEKLERLRQLQSKLKQRTNQTNSNSFIERARYAE